MAIILHTVTTMMMVMAVIDSNPDTRTEEENAALNAGRSTDPDTRLMLTILPMVTTMWAMMMVMMMVMMMILMATVPDTKLMLTNDNASIIPDQWGLDDEV